MEEETIKNLLKPWQRRLLTHFKSRFLAQLTGIERRHSHDFKDMKKVIEIWQHGKLKARSTWHFGSF